MSVANGNIRPRMLSRVCGVHLKSEFDRECSHLQRFGLVGLPACRGSDRLPTEPLYDSQRYCLLSFHRKIICNFLTVQLQNRNPAFPITIGTPNFSVRVADGRSATCSS